MITEEPVVMAHLSALVPSFAKAQLGVHPANQTSYSKPGETFSQLQVRFVFLWSLLDHHTAHENVAVDDLGSS